MIRVFAIMVQCSIESLLTDCVKQMFLLKIPGGLFGAEVEHQLLRVLELNGLCDQFDAIHWCVFYHQLMLY